MRQVLAFLAEPWDPAVLDHTGARVVLPTGETSSDEAAQAIYTDALELWRQTLSGEERAQVETGEAGAVMRALGYL